MDPEIKHVYFSKRIKIFLIIYSLISACLVAASLLGTMLVFLLKTGELPDVAVGALYFFAPFLFSPKLLWLGISRYIFYTIIGVGILIFLALIKKLHSKSNNTLLELMLVILDKILTPRYLIGITILAIIIPFSFTIINSRIQTEKYESGFEISKQAVINLLDQMKQNSPEIIEYNYLVDSKKMPYKFANITIETVRGYVTYDIFHEYMKNKESYIQKLYLTESMYLNGTKIAFRDMHSFAIVCSSAENNWINLNQTYQIGLSDSRYLYCYYEGFI